MTQLSLDVVVSTGVTSSGWLWFPAGQCDSSLTYAREEVVMGFGEAAKSFWSNYATFKGRSRRSEYWSIQLLLVITNLGLLHG
jgi:hypothetical protein